MIGGIGERVMPTTRLTDTQREAVKAASDLASLVGAGNSLMGNLTTLATDAAAGGKISQPTLHLAWMAADALRHLGYALSGEPQ